MSSKWIAKDAEEQWKNKDAWKDQCLGKAELEAQRPELYYKREKIHGKQDRITGTQIQKVLAGYL